MGTQKTVVNWSYIDGIILCKPTFHVALIANKLGEVHYNWNLIVIFLEKS